MRKFFKFESDGVLIPECEINEVVRYVIGFIEENKYPTYMYKNKDFISDTVELIVTNSMEGSGIYQYYHLIPKRFSKEIYKRIRRKLERGE